MDLLHPPVPQPPGGDASAVEPARPWAHGPLSWEHAFGNNRWRKWLHRTGEAKYVGYRDAFATFLASRWEAAALAAGVGADAAVVDKVVVSMCAKMNEVWTEEERAAGKKAFQQAREKQKGKGKAKAEADDAALRIVSLQDEKMQWLQFVPESERKHGMRASELIEIALRHMPYSHPDRAKLVRDLEKTRLEQRVRKQWLEDPDVNKLLGKKAILPSMAAAAEARADLLAASDDSSDCAIAVGEAAFLRGVASGMDAENAGIMAAGAQKAWAQYAAAEKAAGRGKAKAAASDEGASDEGASDGAIAAGEEVCISYVATDLPHAERQHIFRHKYGFECACPVCRAGADAAALRQVFADTAARYSHRDLGTENKSHDEEEYEQQHLRPNQRLGLRVTWGADEIHTETSTGVFNGTLLE